MTDVNVAARKKTGRRWVRVLKRIAISLLVILILLIYGVFPFMLSSFVPRAGTRPMDRNLTQTPSTYGAEYKDVQFVASDGVSLSGWLLPSRSKHVTIVYSHGLFRSRRELLERAVDFWKLGYGALLYDSRNHGDSGKAFVTLGYTERFDVEGAVKFLREQAPTDKIVSFGISMGAAAALLAAAETPEIDAVIADSSFLSFQDTTSHHVRLLRLPAFPLANELRFFIQRNAGFDGRSLNPLEAVVKLGDRPAMFISAARDRRMPPSIADTLYQTSQSPKKDLLVIDGPQADVHGHAYQANSQLYIQRVSAFLDWAIDSRA